MPRLLCTHPLPRAQGAQDTFRQTHLAPVGTTKSPCEGPAAAVTQNQEPVA